ncbi:MAG: hypothetical protein ACRD6W_06460 [Nitrososphaerales archaeon]
MALIAMDRRVRYTIDWLSIALGTLAAYLVKDLPPFASVLHRIKNSKKVRAIASASILLGTVYAMSLVAVIVWPWLFILTSDNPFGSAVIQGINLGLNAYEWAGIVTIFSMAFILMSSRSLVIKDIPSDLYLY